MKVILTGFTTDTAKGTSIVGFESMSTGLKKMLTALGHEHVLKPMRVETNDEDLEWADVLVVGIGPVNALGSRFCLTALDAIAKARKHDCGLVFYVTDWQTHLIGSGNRSIIKNPFNLTKWHLRNRDDFKWGVHNNEYLINIVKSFENRPWPITLVPVHTWFNPDSVRSQKLIGNLPAREHVFMDPTMFTTRTWNLPEVDPNEKSHEYVLAALGDYTKWMDRQEIGWPVRHLGGRTFDVRKAEKDENGEPIKNKNARVKETEVNENYAETWVGISPKHSLSGSAWWRTRYDFILRSGSILYGEKDEIGPIGDAFNVTPELIESMTTPQLTGLAKAQLEQYEAKIEPADSVLAKLEHALRAGRTQLGLATYTGIMR